MYSADAVQKAVYSLTLEKNGIGLQGANVEPVVQYGEYWREVNSMCIQGENLSILTITG